MAAWRQALALVIDDEELAQLTALAHGACESRRAGAHSPRLSG